MDKTVQMDQLAQRLLDATAAQNWSALEVVDRQLATLLAHTVASASTLTQPEIAALRALEHAHRQAQAQCTNATEQLAQRLNDLQSHKDGWMAYAVHSDLNEAAQ